MGESSTGISKALLVSKRLCYNQFKMKRDGFTIVEVMIFLAISGLMLTMAVIGSGNLARQARYSDSVNSFHSMMQRTYEEVANGVNARQSTEEDCVTGGGQPHPPGTDDCLLIGKVVSFDYNYGQIATIRYVTDSPNTTPSGTPQQQISAALPRVQDSGSEAYELAWGASIQVASRETNPTAGGNPIKPGTTRAIINNVAFLRSPGGSQIIPYYFYSSAQTAASVQTGLRAAVATTLAAVRANDTKAYICITNREDWTTASAPVSAVVLGEGQGSVGIDTNFVPDRTPAGECNL